jgi:hypothetical protein
MTTNMLVSETQLFQHQSQGRRASRPVLARVPTSEQHLLQCSAQRLPLLQKHLEGGERVTAAHINGHGAFTHTAPSTDMSDTTARACLIYWPEFFKIPVPALASTPCGPSGIREVIHLQCLSPEPPQAKQTRLSAPRLGAGQGPRPSPRPAPRLNASRLKSPRPPHHK